MENFMIIFCENPELTGISEIKEIVQSRFESSDFIGSFDMEENHSCVIFANEGQFDLTLIKQISELQGFEVSVGTVDTDEIEWMTSLDLAA